jgi:hypothetical protein
METELAALPSRTLATIRSFYANVHQRLAPSNDTWLDFDTCIAAGQSSMAIIAFEQVQASFHQDLAKLRFDLAVEDETREQQRLERESKKASAMELEAETPPSELVGTLVRQAVRQQVGPLKKQLNDIQKSLNDSAGRHGTPSKRASAASQQPRRQIKQPQRPPKPQRNGNGTGKAAAAGQGSGNKRTNTPAGKPKSNRLPRRPAQSK